jgi:hypothetical protein
MKTKNKKIIILSAVGVLIMGSSIVFAKQILSPEKRRAYDEKFKQIDKRADELMAEPLPQTEEELQARIKRGEQLKNEAGQLVKEAESEGYYDNEDKLDTKEELIAELDRVIDVIQTWLRGNPADEELKQEMKARLDAFVAFKSKVEAASEKDIPGLIAEYNQNLKVNTSANYEKLKEG